MAVNIPGTSAEIRTAFLNDIELGAREYGVTDPPIEPGSDWHNLGTAVANVALIQNTNVALSERDSSVLTAEGDALDDIRKQNGLPELPPQGARGFAKIRVTGSTTIVEGEESVAAKNGLRYATVTTTTAPVDGQEIELQCVDTGAETDLDSGETLTWANPPPNVGSQLTVSNTVPILGGRSEESDEEKRERILERKRNPPGGGNWAQLVAVAESVPSVQGAYAYPALGGPSSYKIVITRTIIPEDDDYTRIPSDAMVREVREQIFAIMPDGNASLVQAVAEEITDISLSLDIPDSRGAGGDGTGWTNDTPWPPLAGGDTEVKVSVVTSTTQITTDASTTTSPVAGQTRIAWWSEHNQQFYTRLITAASGSTGAWVITLDKPLVDDLSNSVAVGDYISPEAASVVQYGNSWREIMATIGPGENTDDADRLPRSERHPATDASDPPNVNSSLLRALQGEHPEIFDAELTSVTVSSPTVPVSVDLAPNVLALRKFGVYPL
jgi:uncharacterized phage protein gp47/JayE